MKLLVECENLRGYYQLEKTGFNSVKILVDSFKSGEILKLKLEKLPEYAEKEIYEAASDRLDSSKFHSVVYEDMKFDGIIHLFKDSQYLLLYGSKMGHVYHKPDAEYKL